MRLRHRSVSAIAGLFALSAALASPGTAMAQGGTGMSTTGAYLAANAAALRSDLFSAAYFYRIVFDRNPGNTQLAARVLILWTEAGEIDQAARVADAVLATNPGFERARIVLGAQAFADGNYQLAQTHFDAIAGSGLPAITASIVSAWAKVGEGDIQAALDDLASVETSQLFRLFHGALVADLAGQPDLALALISEIYQPGSSQRLTEAFARILARNGFIQDAESVLEDFLEGAPDHPILAPLLAEIRDGAEIDPMIQTAREGAAELFYGLASTLIGDNDIDGATIYLQFARYLGPSTDLPTVLLGQLLRAQQRHEEAVDVLDSIAFGSPFYAGGAIGASISDSILGFRDRAIARLVPIVAADPADTDTALALAAIFASEQRWDEVIDVLSLTIDAAEIFRADDWQLFYQRGIAYERSGRWEEAEVEFERALALSPDQPDVLNYLGYVWVDEGVNLLEALDMIERAVRQSPSSAAIVDSLGWAYYRLGDYESAVETLEAAVLMSPYHPTLLEHLGDAYWRVGRTLEATYKWAQALAEDPDEDAATVLRDKIDNGLIDLDGVQGGIFELR